MHPYHGDSPTTSHHCINKLNHFTRRLLFAYSTLSNAPINIIACLLFCHRSTTRRHHQMPHLRLLDAIKCANKYHPTPSFLSHFILFCHRVSVECPNIYHKTGPRAGIRTQKIYKGAGVLRHTAHFI